jgi:hypothetical protein
MSPEEIKAALVRPAVEFTAGGFRPTYAATESWLGRVYMGRPGETLPRDAQGRPMWPLLQLVLAGLPAVPGALAATQALAVFIGQEPPIDSEPAPNGQNWLLREYAQGEALVLLEMPCPTSPLKPFPLQAGAVVADYPVWDGGGADHLATEIVALERAGHISSYHDLVENHYGHKLGGWPSFCQPGIEFSPGFGFVLQIASDAKAQLNIVDGGTIFLAKNAATGEWEFYCDFY